MACLIRSGRRGQGHMALQGMEQPVWSYLCLGVDNRQRVTPGSPPMGSLAGSNGGAQTKPPKPQGQLRRVQAGVRRSFPSSTMTEMRAGNGAHNTNRNGKERGCRR